MSTLVRVFSQTWTHQFLAFLFSFKNFFTLQGQNVRVSCVQSCLCQDFCAVKVTYVQTIVRSFVFTDRVISNARHHLCAFISVRTYQRSILDLSLASFFYQFLPLSTEIRAQKFSSQVYRNLQPKVVPLSRKSNIIMCWQGQ